MGTHDGHLQLELEQLLQLRVVTADGDLISKVARDSIVMKGYAMRHSGFNMLTPHGLQVLLALKLLTGTETAEEKRKWV